ncbi:MAG: hypothetical protein LKE40_03680 [Spirochaetia bacterium]|jgi:hypothetical protein|nr:hypothetical protein [Spirochaetia bacterium]
MSNDDTTMTEVLQLAEKLLAADPWKLFSSLDVLGFQPGINERAYIFFGKEGRDLSMQVFVGSKAFKTLCRSFDIPPYASGFDYLEKELKKDCYCLSFLSEEELQEDELSLLTSHKWSDARFPVFRRQHPMSFQQELSDDENGLDILKKAMAVVLDATAYFPAHGKDKENSTFQTWFEETGAKDSQQLDYIPFAKGEKKGFLWQPLQVDWIAEAEELDIPGPFSPDSKAVTDARHAKQNPGQIAYFDIFCPGFPIEDYKSNWRYCYAAILTDLKKGNEEPFLHFFFPEAGKDGLFYAMATYMTEHGKPLAIKAFGGRSLALAEELFAPLGLKVSKEKPENKRRLVNAEERALDSFAPTPS